jgi:cytoskeletal protein CcmA (bactofilin family)
MGSVGKPHLPPGAALESKNLPTTKTSPLAADRPTAWLGPSFHIKGDITGAEDLEIDGSVEGMIQLDEAKLTVGAAAKLKADISARDVVVYGCVKGNVRAAGMIEIKKDGSVTGNLTTAQIMIGEGADFKGSIEIETPATKEPDKNTGALAASAGAEGPRTRSDAQDTWTPLERPN